LQGVGGRVGEIDQRHVRSVRVSHQAVERAVLGDEAIGYDIDLLAQFGSVVG
jgi:hypothetical protein